MTLHITKVLKYNHIHTLDNPTETTVQATYCDYRDTPLNFTHIDSPDTSFNIDPYNNTQLICNLNNTYDIISNPIGSYLSVINTSNYTTNYYPVLVNNSIIGYSYGYGAIPLNIGDHIVAYGVVGVTQDCANKATVYIAPSDQ